MPRTKRPASTKEKSAVKDDVLKKLEKIVAEQKANIDSRIHMECRNVDLAFKILLGTISNIHLNKTVGQLKHELHIKEVASSMRKTRNSSRSASHDDGYLTETSQGSGGRDKKMAPPSTVRGHRSRSAETSRKIPAPTTAAKTTRRRSRSVYRTPAYNKMSQHNYPAITPKVAPHTPLTVLRQPRQGEMVVSMSGSPVMVPSVCTMASDEKANCNIMLQDGTMLSLQPRQLRQSQAFIPFSLMDANVLHQLKTLKDNLDKVVKLGENVFK
ncbi:hypothetical protein MSG28_013979 [Choristoneura fumiferana]|uniref:Uncharacterized protein n=1 Tax=Choristoneura fumiferana TaxID=7141 RepID=A0ACC0K9I1_CHOFU|nr:hypothetical protein MSG28_013979 [Choristoneura fumiferana]